MIGVWPPASTEGLPRDRSLHTPRVERSGDHYGRRWGRMPTSGRIRWWPRTRLGWLSGVDHGVGNRGGSSSGSVLGLPSGGSAAGPWRIAAICLAAWRGIFWWLGELVVRVPPEMVGVRRSARTRGKSIRSTLGEAVPGGFAGAGSSGGPPGRAGPAPGCWSTIGKAWSGNVLGCRIGCAGACMSSRQAGIPLRGRWDGLGPRMSPRTASGNLSWGWWPNWHGGKWPGSVSPPWKPTTWNRVITRRVTRDRPHPAGGARLRCPDRRRIRRRDRRSHPVPEPGRLRHVCLVSPRSPAVFTRSCATPGRALLMVSSIRAFVEAGR